MKTAWAGVCRPRRGYPCAIRILAATALVALTLAGCGTTRTNDSASHTASTFTDPAPAAPTQRAHPQVVEPAAGAVAPVAAPPGLQQYASARAHAADPVPSGPATNTNAPARGAPSEAQVRAEVAKFQVAVAQYHLDRLNLRGALLDPSQLPPGVYNVSVASVFTDYGLPIACGGVLHVPQLGVANKTLPCGTMVTFKYGNRAIRVPVLDRGPYIPGREWDLTGAAAEALKFPGLGYIQWRIG